MISPLAKIHPSAIIDKGATVGDHTSIWHWVHICSGAVIGNNCSFGQNVFVANKVHIGNNVRVQNNVSIYDNVTLQDDVFCGPSAVFTNVINPRSSVPRKNEYLDTLIERGATLGANCTIVCGNTIGHDAFIAAGAVITKDVKPYALVAGTPARQIGWMSSFGNRIRLPLEGTGSWVCPASNNTYELLGDTLTLKESCS